MTEVLTHYPAGADVPDWLIAVEPGAPGAVFESLKFMSPAIVADLPDRFLVFSPDLSSPPPSLHIVGGANRVYAAAKPVHFVIAGASFWGLDVNAWTPVADLAQQNPPPHPWSRPMQVPGRVPQVAVPTPQPDPYQVVAQQEQERLYAAQQAAQMQQARPGLWRRLWEALKAS